jgi:hypothetical protein
MLHICGRLDPIGVGKLRLRKRKYIMIISHSLVASQQGEQKHQSKKSIHMSLLVRY